MGFRHLCEPDHPLITETEAEVYLTQDLVSALAATLRYFPVLATDSNERLVAIADFIFTFGAGLLQTSALRRRINQLNWSEIAQKFRRWVHSGGKVLPGLVSRREAELRLLDY
ncbi:MAG TPA: lysozyme [Rhodoferax sp.]|nr:lysozyme [Rhodoferax sp.]